MEVDFAAPRLNYWRRHGNIRQNIAKAVGIKSGYRPFVVDATAGLGQDAFILASLGCKVHLIERSEIIYNLLETGFNKACQMPEIMKIIQNMKLFFGDSKNILKNISKNLFSDIIRPDTVYIDPMFGNNNKNALAKKELCLVGNIVGQDQDAGELLEIALKIALNRVVVKRRRRMSSLICSGCKPSFIVFGKAICFDVYMTV